LYYQQAVWFIPFLNMCFIVKELELRLMHRRNDDAESVKEIQQKLLESKKRAPPACYFYNTPKAAAAFAASVSVEAATEVTQLSDHVCEVVTKAAAAAAARASCHAVHHSMVRTLQAVMALGALLPPSPALVAVAEAAAAEMEYNSINIHNNNKSSNRLSRTASRPQRRPLLSNIYDSSMGASFSTNKKGVNRIDWRGLDNLLCRNGISVPRTNDAASSGTSSIMSGGIVRGGIGNPSITAQGTLHSPNTAPRPMTAPLLSSASASSHQLPQILGKEWEPHTHSAMTNQGQQQPQSEGQQRRRRSDGTTRLNQTTGWQAVGIGRSVTQTTYS
jgi:hypothetical protein